MRLLSFDKEVRQISCSNRDAPPYAVLSHTWGPDEVFVQDLMDGTANYKLGFLKIKFCGNQAAQDGLKFFWLDCCCIDSKNGSELSEAINSIFSMFQRAAKCYVFLSDVSTDRAKEDSTGLYSWQAAFRQSRWFTRSWTLQELIAPASIEFFSLEGDRLGDKQSLEQLIHEASGIAIEALRGRPLSHFSVAERMSWAYRRYATREEDKPYSLLGIFNVQMALIYGEGTQKALLRLWEEILKTNEGYSVLLWNRPSGKIDTLEYLSPLALDYCLAREDIKDSPKTLEWSELAFHSPLSLVSASTLASYLSSVNKTQQIPQITAYGLRMSLLSKAVGVDLICWTYYTQECKGSTYAVCVRVISTSPGNPTDTQRLQCFLSGDVHYVKPSRLRGFELKDVYFVLCGQQ